MAAAAEEEGAGSGRRVAAKYNRFMSVENPRHFVYEDEIYIKYIIFVYKYALILTLTLTLTLNPNLSVYEYDIHIRSYHLKAENCMYYSTRASHGACTVAFRVSLTQAPSRA